MEMIRTAWMWEAEGQVWGLLLEGCTLEWMDSIGCACGTSFATQTAADYRANGPRYGRPPDDVLAEIDDALKALCE